MRFHSIPVQVTGIDAPTGADLAAIEAEWPAIAAELDELDDEIRAMGVCSVLSEVEVRRARRVRRTALRSVPALAGVESAGSSGGARSVGSMVRGEAA